MSNITDVMEQYPCICRPPHAYAVPPLADGWHRIDCPEHPDCKQELEKFVDLTDRAVADLDVLYRRQLVYLAKHQKHCPKLDRYIDIKRTALGLKLNVLKVDE